MTSFLSLRRRVLPWLSAGAVGLLTVTMITPAEAGRGDRWRDRGSYHRSSGHRHHTPHRFCGSHRHHHGHTWCNGHRDFYCEGHE